MSAGSSIMQTSCEQQDSWVPPDCNLTSDLCFYSRQNGVCKVSHERWQRAQEAEGSLWRTSGGSGDRVHDHMEGFSQYEAVPEYLGHLLEVGCGPWTQLGAILDLPNRTWIVDSITLWEPGAQDYMANVANCAYKDSKLRGRPVSIMPLGAELINATEAYDTILMINVLEHVQNSYTILENVHRALKPGGLLIFNDRWWDHYNWKTQVNASSYEGLDHLYHPIKCNRIVHAHFLSHFVPYHQSVNPVAVTKYGPKHKGVYFIGVKASVPPAFSMHAH
eukprot:gene12241-12379_t